MSSIARSDQAGIFESMSQDLPSHTKDATQQQEEKRRKREEKPVGGSVGELKRTKRLNEEIRVVH